MKIIKLSYFKVKFVSKTDQLFSSSLKVQQYSDTELPYNKILNKNF